MDPANIEKLQKYRPKLQVWRSDQTVHLDANEKTEILDVIRAEFDAGYKVDLWCGSCVVRMMEYAFAELDKRIDNIKIEF